MLRNLLLQLFLVLSAVCWSQDKKITFLFTNDLHSRLAGFAPESDYSPLVSGNVSDMKSAILDMDEKMPQVQEGKEWLAIMEFIRSMKDTNANGIPDVDLKYSRPGVTFHISTTPAGRRRL